jgi:hypothetical protein
VLKSMTAYPGVRVHGFRARRRIVFTA